MNVAIIGCGTMGKFHAAMAVKCGLKVTVCADIVQKSANELAKEYGAVSMHNGLPALSRDDVDIVVVATPTPSHAALVQAAAKEGKHIFCEKPFCRTVAECKATIDVANKYGVKLFIGHVVRYFQEFEAVRNQIQNGVIGDAGFARLYRGGAYPAGEDNWFRNYKVSGGVTLDCMIHDLDWIRFVFGEPERIFCQSLQRTTPEYLDYSQVTMRMKSGLIAKVIGTWAHPSGFRVMIEVCGSKGMVQFDSKDAPLSSQRRQDGAAVGTIVPSSPVLKSPYLLEWEDFIGWLNNEHEPKVTPEDGLRAVAMATAALKSVETQEPVNL